jgi:2-polyprenyl-3-methyl-5-hydroxy-6-metoxy-1,4-benzoquinol methylase
MHGVPGAYSYRRCRRCRTVFQDPRVIEEDLKLLYPPEYYTHAQRPPGSTVVVTERARPGLKGRIRMDVQAVQAPDPLGRPPSWWGRLLGRSRWLRERAFHDLVPDEMLPWQVPAGRALDVGCGSGELMTRLMALGWQVMGVDPDARAAGVARERTGADVRVSGVGSLREQDLGRFELVTVSHVLEHLAAPGDALRTLAGLLAPGGRVVAMFPNPDALAARLFGQDWFAWDAPRHLVLPPLDAVRFLLEGTGLLVRRARTLDRWAADHAMQSAAYRRGEGLQDDVPGRWHRGLGVVERALVAAGADLGEEILLHLERRT